MARGKLNFFNKDMDNQVSDYEDVDSFEEKYTPDDENTFNKESFADKIIDTFKNMNDRTIIFLVFLGIVIMTTVIVACSIISNNNKLYNSVIDIPDIVYIGQSDNIVVNATAKKNVSSIVTNFKSSDEDVITMLNGSVEGPNVYDVMVPISEGRVTVSAESFLGNRKLGSEKKEVVVCPKFDSSLVFSRAISVVQGTYYNININFGEKGCSKGVSYQSSNNNIMTISDKNEIVGVNVGTANLIVKKGDMSFNIPVNITSSFIPLEELNTNFSELQLMKDEMYRITGSFSPSNATYQKLVFSSYDHEIIDISEDGIITALKEGSTDLIISSSDKYGEKKVKVSVYKPLSGAGVEPSSLELSVSSLVMNVGNTHKVYSVINPDNTRDKRIEWHSSNDNIAMVTKSGVIYAKGTGSAVITAKTSNGIEKSIRVRVDSFAKPIVTASDGVSSDGWHKDKYTLNVFGSVRGSDYFYGTDEMNINNKSSKVEVLKDGKTIYYFKSCLGDACSPSVSYISKLDTIKPKVLKAEKSSNSASGSTVYLHLEDTGSLVSKWCVVSKNDHTLCQWSSINPMAKPIVAYVGSRNGTYYAFAKDVVGNISDGISFKIDGMK